MKKIKLFLIVFFLIFFVKNNLFAIDTVSIRYFPMHVGDFWVYNCHRFTSGVGHTYWITKMQVMNVVITNNHIYYVVAGYPYGDTLRTDSISGSLRKYIQNNNCPYYYKERLNDSLAVQYNGLNNNCADNSICGGTSTIEIFGMIKSKKGFSYSAQYQGSSRSFVSDFGLYTYGDYISAPGGFNGFTNVDLKGCRINGVVYGDTSTVSIKNLSSEIPDRFELYQNFPNPFNNTSNLKFQIVNTGDVKLVVYDIMGREVQTLVNERLQPGTYETSFDGTNFPSGVYYYRIEAGDFVKSKSMILIK